MPKYNSLIEDLTKLVAAFTIFLVFASFLHLLIYYTIFFEVRIVYFITPSEIILSSFTDILPSLYALSLLMIIYYAYHSRVIKSETVDEEPLIKKEKLFWNRLFIYSLSFSGALALLFFLLKWQNAFFDLLLIFDLVLFTKCGIFLLHSIKSLKNFKNYYIKLYFGILAFGALTFLAILAFDSLKFFGIKTHFYVSKRMNIHFKDGEILRTSDSMFLFGKTEKYYYIWDRKKDSIFLYSSDEVKQIDQ